MRLEELEWGKGSGGSSADGDNPPPSLSAAGAAVVAKGDKEGIVSVLKLLRLMR